MDPIVKAKRLVRLRVRQLANARRSLAILRARRKAVTWAMIKTGTVEHPPGSNKGPGISEWEKRWLGYDGYSWCGAFAGCALEAGGVKGLVGARIVYTPAILEDARAGKNGFEKLVPLEKARRGDLILMDFEAGGAPVMHVGVARDWYRGGGVIKTIEGNTSSGTVGSQDNGGGVFPRVRPRSVIVGVARPRW